MCTLVRRRLEGTEEEMAKKETALKKPGSYRLRFANVDQRLTVWVDRTLPFGDGVDYEAPRKGGRILRGPKEENDLEPASIGVRGASVSVRELKLFRDIYYTNKEAMTMYVQPGYYLCLGDNSPQSADSRSWPWWDDRPTHNGKGGLVPEHSRGGLVPEHLMLGRALWVYWPPARFGPIR
jgi:signal peptidase I